MAKSKAKSQVQVQISYEGEADSMTLDGVILVGATSHKHSVLVAGDIEPENMLNAIFIALRESFGKDIALGAIYHVLAVLMREESAESAEVVHE